MATLLSALETRARRELLELPALSAPSAPTVTPQGVSGATAYSYVVVAGHRHGATEASSAGSTASGNATLSSSNFNRVTWTAVTGATNYFVYRTVGGATTGLVAVVGDVAQLDDTGLTGDTTTAPTANTSGGQFWSSEELITHLADGARDLWGAVVDLNQEHFLTVDVTNVSLAANATQLTGVPSDCFRVHLIEPRDTTNAGSTPSVLFWPRDYNSAAFRNARQLSAQDPIGGLDVVYTLTSAGPPIAAPVVLTAPLLSSAVSLRFVYVPTLGALTAASNNPIPGESDKALVAWCIAYARAKEREDKSPDPNYLAVYATEKQNLMVRMTPRQTQEPEVVEGLFDAYQ